MSLATQHVPYWHEFRQTAIGIYQLEHEQGFVLEHLDTAHVGPSRVLEIGSGTGSVTLPLRDRPGVEIVGLDHDFDSLSMFLKRPGDHPAVMADASQLPFADESFDAVVAVQCFRYADPDRFTRECRRVLKPNGSLLFQFVNRRNYKRLIKTLTRRTSKRHDIYATRTVLDLLASRGFHVYGLRGYNWVPLTPSITAMSNSSLIRYAASVEAYLGLGRLHEWSPWLLAAARRVE